MKHGQYATTEIRWQKSDVYDTQRSPILFT